MNHYFLIPLILFISLANADTNEELFQMLSAIKSEASERVINQLPKAKAGNPKAQLKVAQSYLAIIPGTHASKTTSLREQAWYWYEKAMTQDTDKKVARTAEKEAAYSYYLEEREDKLRAMVKGRYPEGFYQLGLLLLKKDHNSKEGIAKLEAVAKQGHVKAAEKLADQYSNYFTDHYDVKKSYQWHKEAAKKGDPRYIYELAKMYHHGFGDKWPEFEKNIRQANIHYLEASNYGNTDAQLYLIQFLLRAKNYKNAHILADELIKKKRAEGYFYKSEMLFNGQGIAVDKDKAIELMKVAKKKDYYPAGSALESMEELR